MRRPSIFVMAGILVALGLIYLFSSRPAKPGPTPEPRPYIWSVDMWDLRVITISLPRGKKSETWIKHEDQYWYFDRPNGPKVDMKRWGGGIPLLLSGPGADRLISGESTADRLALYGFQDPAMKVDLTLNNGDVVRIIVGDTTPGGDACYIKRVDAQEIYTVDRSWFDVLERLVREPPYPQPEREPPDTRED